MPLNWTETNLISGKNSIYSKEDSSLILFLSVHCLLPKNEELKNAIKYTLCHKVLRYDAIRFVLVIEANSGCLVCHVCVCVGRDLI